MTYEELVGKRFGRRTVIKLNEPIQLYYPNGTKNGKLITYTCRCDCGKELSVKRWDLLGNKTKSCGCYRSEVKKRAKTTHGLCYTRLNRIYHEMKSRCLCKTSDKYVYYGGRGISICKEWVNNFKSFYDWAVENEYSDKLTIDRIDVNGNYCPENCRWVTQAEQTRNTRRTRNYKGKCLSEWWRYFNIPYSRFYSLVKELGLGGAVEHLLSKEV